MSRTKLTIDNVLAEGDSISSPDLRALLTRLPKKDILAYAQTRFYGRAFHSNLNKNSLIDMVIEAHEAEEEVQIPETGQTLSAVMANLRFAAPMDPETQLQMARRLPPPRILNLDGAPAAIRDTGAIVVDSRNAPRVRLPETPSEVVSGSREAPSRIGKVRENTSPSSGEYKEVLQEIDRNKLEASVGHGKGYSHTQLTSFRKRLNQVPSSPFKIESSLKKPQLVRRLQEILDEVL